MRLCCLVVLGVLLLSQLGSATAGQPLRRRLLEEPALASAAAPAPAEQPAAPAPAPAEDEWGGLVGGPESSNMSAVSLRSTAPLPIPPMPDWVLAAAARLPGGSDPRGDKPVRVASITHNRQVMAAANQAGRRLDVAWFGDSITALLWMRHSALWDQHFKGLDAEPFGVPGATVQEVAYLLASGMYRLDQDPRVIVLLIGINNINGYDGAKDDVSTPARLAWLLNWLAAAHPDSRVLVLLPLPAKQHRWKRLRADYQALLAAQFPNVAVSLCGAGLDPDSPELFLDGVHPTEAGYERVLSCIEPQIEELLDAAIAEEASAAAAEEAAVQLAAMQAKQAAAARQAAAAQSPPPAVLVDPRPNVGARKTVG